MKLSKLIQTVGDDNVEFQNLDDDIIRFKNTFGKEGFTEITFGTKAPTTMFKTKKVGLVVWLDREAVEKAIKENA